MRNKDKQCFLFCLLWSYLSLINSEHFILTRNDRFVPIPYIIVAKCGFILYLLMLEVILLIVSKLLVQF